MTIFYRAKHILLEEKEDTEYILDQLDGGVRFEDLASEFSECDSAARGGDLGRFSSGTMDAAFERALFQMKIGEIRPYVQTKYGHHIILRLE
jgi:peptidyl-prolyl cis-trans isomerase C